MKILKNLIKNLFTPKHKKHNKIKFTFATPPNNNNNSKTPKFQIGDSTKLKNELKSTKGKLEEISSQNKTLAQNSEKYITEKSKAGKKRHQKTEIIKTHIIKPMFDNRELIKSTSTKQRAEKIEKELVNIFDEDDEEKLQNFAQKYNLDFEILKYSKDYFLDEKSETIYRWCLKFSK